MDHRTTIKRKRSWSKQSEVPQMMAKSGLTPRKVMLCMYGRIGKESFTTSCCRLVKRLILTSTVNNWKDYAKKSRESDQNWNSIEKASSSIITTPDPKHLWRPVKNWKKLDWEILIHPPYPDLIPSDYHLFQSLQNLMESWLQKRPMKITCRNFSSRNHRISTVTRLLFYLKNGRWSNKIIAHIWFNKFHLKYEKTSFLL